MQETKDYCGPPFKATRGMTQEGVFSHSYFNIFIDNVIRYWLSLVINDDGKVSHNGFGATVAERLSLLYADDGVLGARDNHWLQNRLNVLVSLVRRVG